MSSLSHPPKLYRSRPRPLKVGDRVRLDAREPIPTTNYHGANRYGSVRSFGAGRVLLKIDTGEYHLLHPDEEPFTQL